MTKAGKIHPSMWLLKNNKIIVVNTDKEMRSDGISCAREGEGHQLCNYI